MGEIAISGPMDMRERGRKRFIENRAKLIFPES